MIVRIATFLKQSLPTRTKQTPVCRTPTLTPRKVPKSRSSPQEGWHCSHFFYSFDRAALREFSALRIREQAADELAAMLDPAAVDARSACRLRSSPGTRPTSG